jgi:hypothetical protein
VRGSAVEWTRLRPNDFQQNFAEELSHAGELASPADTVPEPFMDLEDLANATVTVSAEPRPARPKDLRTGRAASAPLRPGCGVDLPGIRASGLPTAYRRIFPAEYTATTLFEEGVGDDVAHHVAVMMQRRLLVSTTYDLATDRPACRCPDGQSAGRAFARSHIGGTTAGIEALAIDLDAPVLVCHAHPRPALSVGTDQRVGSRQSETRVFRYILVSVLV